MWTTTRTTGCSLTREFGDLKVHEVPSAKAFARALRSNHYDAVVTDYELKWSNGLEILRAVRTQWPEMPVVMFTGTGNEEIAVQ